MSVITAPARDARVKRIYEIAREYRAKGYHVLVGPSQHELPPFLGGFEPDLVVTSDDDKAVVTVKPYRDLVGSNALSRMAVAIERQPGWRNELVLVPSEPDPEQPLPDSASVEGVGRLLGQARALGESSLAIVPAFAAVENAMLVALEREGLELSSPYPSTALKTLFAYGLLSRDQYDQLDALMRLRDEVTHGRATDADVESWLVPIELIVQELLSGAAT